ncbi:hypothetical protein COW53_03960 [bacterium CG17_big_fil_post_rev_8_21_14_2_50_64_8]|nr:MAG: hypothetical protein COW53_03960 [bacterium CG17_big_fil_post_rev_8_21_14_2_50_64_8]PJA76718.1 MAG: hypothetical protein CO151_02055 [bacterium CG_4_9_14_3_um_filter_65_15]
MTGGRWKLIPALVAAVVLNLLLIVGAALLAGDRPVSVPKFDPLPVTLTTLDRPDRVESESTPTPPPPQETRPRPEFSPVPDLPRLAGPDLGSVKVQLDPSLWRDEPPLGDFVFNGADLDEPPRALVRTKPQYPFKEQQRGVDGYVEVKLLVDADGLVSSVQVLQSDPPGVFDDAALKAVPNWKFAAGRIEGRPVPSWVVTRVVFTMAGTR